MRLIAFLACQRRAGYTLMEVLVGVFIFALLATALLSLAALATRTAIESERRVVGQGLANAELERIRAQVPYDDIGFIDAAAGEPDGVLQRLKPVEQNKQPYTMEWKVALVDDPANGPVPGELNEVTADYKKVDVIVSGGTQSVTSQVSSVTTSSIIRQVTAGRPPAQACSGAADCPSGVPCVGGTCEPSCQDSGSCPAGQGCSGGQCQPCQSGDCPSGWTCQTGSCQADSCEQVGSCEDQVCPNGYDECLGGRLVRVRWECSPVFGQLEAKCQGFELKNSYCAPIVTYGTCPTTTDCSDGKDNDEDGKIDYSPDGTGDPGCKDYADQSEKDTTDTQCTDGFDNDGDGFVDFDGADRDGDGKAEIRADPLCADRQDDDESGQCNDGKDNEVKVDGRIDDNDPACHTDRDFAKPYDPNLVSEDDTECSDLEDNDNDKRTDDEDPACHTDRDPKNPFSYDPNLDSEKDTQCADLEDNDGDGRTDDEDPACYPDHDKGQVYNPNLDSEVDKQCSDLEDNDKDGFTDEGDPGCYKGLVKLPGAYVPAHDDEGGEACTRDVQFKPGKLPGELVWYSGESIMPEKCASRRYPWIYQMQYVFTADRGDQLSAFAGIRGLEKASLSLGIYAPQRNLGGSFLQCAAWWWQEAYSHVCVPHTYFFQYDRRLVTPFTGTHWVSFGLSANSPEQLPRTPFNVRIRRWP